MKLLCTILGAALLPLLPSCVPYDYNGSIYGGHNYLDGFAQTPGASAINHGGVSAPQGYWDGDGVEGAPQVRINLKDQRAYFFRGGTLVGVSPISTGTDGHSTPRGKFKVTEKDVDHSSSLYGIIKDRNTGQTVNNDADTRRHKPGPNEVFVHAPMPHFVRFNGAIGMHAGFLPGYPASHGCVRLPPKMAKKFFENVSYGTPVIVE